MAVHLRTLPTDATPFLLPRWPLNWVILPLRKLVSVLILALKNSLTSNAIMAICILTRLSLLLQSVPSRCMAASRKRNCPRKTSRLSAMGLRTLPNRSRICAALDCRSWLPSINSLRIHRPKSICSLRNAKATVWMSASTSAGKRWRRRYRHGKQAG